jgi:hypothetical protein
MNLFARTLLLALLIMGTLAARAQDRRYAVVEYMHIPEGKSHDAYLATEKLWQRLHQKAVDAGICRAWILERIENDSRKHFATVRIYDSMEQMANPWPDSIQKDLYNSEESRLMDRTQETRDLIHRELWQFEASAAQTPGGDPSTYVSVQFMKPKPGKTSDYFNMEKGTYMKIHQASVKAGEMKNWHFLTRLFPSGTDADYDFVTIDVFSRKDPSWNTKIVETALGKEEAAKLGDPSEVRTLVRQELWRPVLATTPGKN